MKNEYKKNAAPERFKIDVSNVKTLELVTINLGKWSAHSIRLRPELGGNVTAQDTSPAVTDVVPELETLGAPYNKTQAKIREDAKARLNRLNQQYLQSLDNLMGQLTRQGKHDAVLAVRAEKRRVSAADAELTFGSDAHSDPVGAQRSVEDRASREFPAKHAPPVSGGSAQAVA